MFNEEQMQKMNKIIEMTMRYSAICKDCKHRNCCFLLSIVYQIIIKIFQKNY